MALGVSPRSCLYPAHHTLRIDTLTWKAHQAARVALAKVTPHTPLGDCLSNAIQDRALKVPVHQLVAVVDDCRAVHKILLLKKLTLIYPMLVLVVVIAV